jgi:mannitol/fructose-specific phosphotransferase system IIA component (Ntr-type)/CheY-like chemotaxis protein
MNEHDNFALVPRQPGAIEKAEPGAKRVLSGMVADTLTLAKKGTSQKTRPLRIVMVNDEPGVLKSFEIIIQRWFKDVVVLCFDNSAAAYDELMRTDPDLLITDDTMPGMSGHELCQRLFDSRVAYPIIVDSAWEPTEQWVREFASRGLNISFLPVPCDIESILKAVEAALKTPRNMEASHPVSVRFSAEHIISNLKARERFAAIRELVAHLTNIGQIRPQDEQVVLDAIFKRESSMSTGIGFGIAIPRGRVDCVKDIILAVGVSSSGVEFNTLDEQPVYVSVLSVSPANSQSHEAMLQRITESLGRFLQTNDGVGQLRGCNSAEQIWSILKPIVQRESGV